MDLYVATCLNHIRWQQSIQWLHWSIWSYKWNHLEAL